MEPVRKAFYAPIASANSAYEDFLNKPPPRILHFFFDKGIPNKTRRNSLGPSTFRKSLSRFHRIQTHRVLIWMNRNGTSSDHETCTHFECHVPPIKFNDYTMKHVNTERRYSDYSVKMKDIIKFLKKGLLPLLHIGATVDTIRVAVTEAAQQELCSFISCLVRWSGEPEVQSVAKMLIETST